MVRIDGEFACCFDVCLAIAHTKVYVYGLVGSALDRSLSDKCCYLRTVVVLMLVDEVYQFYLDVFIYLSISCKGATTLCVSGHGTDEFRVFDLLVEVTDEGASCHVT